MCSSGAFTIGCQDEVYLAVNMPIRGVPRCCCRQLVGIESVSKDKSVVLRNLSESPYCVVCLFNVKSSCCSCPDLVCVRAHFGIPIALNCACILLESLCYDVISLLVQSFDLLIVTVWGWCIDLNIIDGVWSRWNPGREESIGDGDAADDTIYNLFFFRTMNATIYWCSKSFPQYHILWPSSIVVSPNSV